MKFRMSPSAPLQILSLNAVTSGFTKGALAVALTVGVAETGADEDGFGAWLAVGVGLGEEVAAVDFAALLAAEPSFFAELDPDVELDDPHPNASVATATAMQREAP
ncbi:MAG: hypothetical protein U0271_46300 [Polyangiaceae bacterium]